MGDAEHETPGLESKRLAPAEIAYRDFGREVDGFAEAEVREFLGRVADTVESTRARARELETRVRELENQVRELEGEPAPAEFQAEEPAVAARASQAAGDVFARIREQREELEARVREEAAVQAAASAPDAPGAEVPGAEVPGADDHERADTEPEPSAEARVLARRGALLDSLTAGLVRSAKRLLQDEQNLLLDACRRARARVEASRLLPEPLHQRDAWAALLGPTLDAAYSGGRTSVGRKRRSANVPVRVLNELAAGVVTPLRERLTMTVEGVVAEGPYASPTELHRALASAIGARYREWRDRDLEVLLLDALVAAYARGAFDGTPSGTRLQWIPEVSGRCPDCDDNALEPTTKGQAFPTGQPYPPAHPGCRCLVVPAIGVERA
jgi:cell division septum initiation protein DivIVA